MTQNPTPILEYSKSPTGIREIARRQRVILLCILAQLCLYALMLMLRSSIPPALSLLLLVLIWVVNIVATVYIFLLATRIYGTGLGILFGILTLIPCVGLVILLIVNAKATTLLRAVGLKVGLLGATIPKDLDRTLPQ
jgi:hypothetical protein